MQGKVLLFSGPFLWKSGVPADVPGSQAEQQGKQILQRMRNKEQRLFCLHALKKKELGHVTAGQPREVEKVITQKLFTLREC